MVVIRPCRLAARGYFCQVIHGIPRRGLLIGATALPLVCLAAGEGAYSLVENGRLPGKSRVDQALGWCDATTVEAVGVPGPVHDGSFESTKRRTRVGYRVVYPPGVAVGARVPVCLVLHGFGGQAAAAIGCGDFDRYTAAYAAAGGTAFALAACDGGPGYWHPHPTDDPLGMVLDEFLPLLASLGLAAGDGDRVAVLGTSMGGYGALLCGLAEPARFTAVAASAPAFWRSYAEAQTINAGAFDSAKEWDAYNVMTRAADLDRLNLRIDCGQHDPFAPAVRALRALLRRPEAVHLAKGCHDGPFWHHAAPAQIRFIGEALARSSR